MAHGGGRWGEICGGGRPPSPSSGKPPRGRGRFSTDRLRQRSVAREVGATRRSVAHHARAGYPPYDEVPALHFPILEWMIMAWSTFFPEGCPPEDAADASGAVFRLVDDRDLTSGAFRVHVDMYPQHHVNDDPHRYCEACGLSVFRSKDGANQLRKIARRFRNSLLATATLSPEHGKLKHTPRTPDCTHYTWWHPISCQPHLLFRIIDEGSSK